MNAILIIIILTWTSITLAQLNQDQFLFLKKMVEINSSTDNLEGLTELRQVIANEFKKLNFEVIRITMTSANQTPRTILQIRRPHSNNTITLLGHIDTVFTLSSTFTLLTIDNKIIRGPGVIDMKSGILLMREIAQNLNEEELNHVQIILNDDEEIGSTYSKNKLRQLIPPQTSILIFEPGLSDGSVVTSQSGVAWFELTTYGKAAHAGLEPQNGFSACTEMGYKISKIVELSNLTNGVNLNPGVLSGGTRPNIVCDQSSLKIDARFKTMNQYQSLTEQLQKITDTIYSSFIPPQFHPSSSLKPLAFLPPLAEDKTSFLFNLLSQLAPKLGNSIRGFHVGYGSDGNNLHDLPVNILVGLGPYGGGMHTKEEFMNLDSFNERLKLNINLIKEIIRQKKNKEN